MKKQLVKKAGMGGLLVAALPGCLVLDGVLNNLGGDTYPNDSEGVCESNEIIVNGVAWQGYNFTADDVVGSCNGERFVRFDEAQGKYVGVALCSADRYKIFLGESLDGTFYQLGDTAGGGQDHCELVNPDFTIPNEDDISSGCPTCAISDFQMWDEAPLGSTGYYRGFAGEPFVLTEDWEGSMHTAEWYECGVSFETESCDNGGDGSCGSPELNIFSSYEARGDHSGTDNHPTGETSVHIERQGAQVVVLSSYEPVHWTVTAAPGAEIVQIIATGYHTPSVTAPEGVAVEIISYETSGEFIGCAYEFPDADPTSGCETPEYIAAVESLTGLEVSSFHGCYQLTSAVLNGDLSSSTNCDDANDGAAQAGYGATSYIDEDCSAGDPGEPSGDLGTYVGFICEFGQPFIITEEISLEDALENCILNTNNNPDLSFYCEWNGQPIFVSEVTPGACSELLGGGDPGDPTDPGCGGEESYCGDGVVDFELGEQCDDGNNEDGDGCDAFCFVEAGCGDETPQPH